MKIFENIAALKLSKLTAGQLVSTKGGVNAGDGAQAEYLVTAGVSPDDSVSPDLANGNHALYQGVGAVNDLSQTYTFATVAAFKVSLIEFPDGKKIFWQGYHAESDGGSNWGIVTSGAHTDDGGSVFTLADGKYVKANLKGITIRPEKFGADAEGVSEAHLQIQATMDYIENNLKHRTMVIEGEYLVGDTIHGRSFASIDGTGTLKAKTALNKPVLQIYAAYPVRRIVDTTYSNFTIDGNQAEQTTTDPQLGACMIVKADVENPSTNGDSLDRGEMFNVSLINIKAINVQVSGFYIGKTTFVQQSYTFSKLSASRGIYGIYLDDYCEYVTFLGCDLQRNQYGVYDNGSSNNSFLGGTYANNTEAGIYIPKTGRNTSKKTISGIKINHNKRGVWIGSGVGAAGVQPDHITITGNHILANTNQGVVGTGGQDVIVKDNTFSGNGDALNDDIYIGISCKRWDVDNKHINSVGTTRHAVYYENPGASGADSHAYHKINGTFEGYTNPIGYAKGGTNPLAANTNFIQGLFEYWNTAGLPPSIAAANAGANVHTNKIPFGTICINNADATGAEQWMATRTPSTNSTSGSNTVIFQRVAVYVP